MENNDVTSRPVFGSSCPWDEKGTYSVLSEDGTARTSFFITPPAVGRMERLDAMAREYRPDRDSDDAEKTFLAEHVLWPREVLSTPRPSVVWPLIPEAFLFGPDSSPDKALSAVREGQLKTGGWFISDKARATMTPQECGDSVGLLCAMADLAHTVGVLHSKGFACCGLSDENVLLNPVLGRAFLTGAESFWTAGLPAPVLGVPIEYAAPEFVGAVRNETAPDFQTLRDADLYSLAVLFYRLLLHRHPLVGPRRSDYGPDALFVENPDDRSNRPENLTATIQNLGYPLERFFLDVFTKGLREPRERPTAAQWEQALEEARRRHEERKRDFRIVKKASAPRYETPSIMGGVSVNLSKTAREDASRGWKISLEWSQAEGVDLDISAFLLRGRSGVVSLDDMVFYGVPVHASNSVRILENIPSDSRQKAEKTMIVEQSFIPSDVSRIDFFVTTYYADRPEYCFKAAKNAFLSIYDGNDNILRRVNLREDFGECSVCPVASLLRENGRMRLTEPRRGYGGGLEAVCGRYGIRVNDAATV